MTRQPQSAPFHADGGRLGVLLSHGFTGSPVSMRPWGQALAGAGWSVRIPLLPGHGSTWQQMQRTRWEDWYAELDRHLSDLRRECDAVAVGGLSMGGCLALRLAQQRGDDVAALVLVNPAVASTNRQLLAVPVLRHLVASRPGIRDDIKKPGVTEGAYDRVPLQALASMMQLWRVVRADLAAVTQPLLVLRSAVDHVVDPSSTRIVLEGVSSSVVREVVLHNSYHVATLDNDAPLIVSASRDFLAEHVGAPLEEVSHEL
ncbi:MAG: alpha/beta fold hydrolase [Actinomycetota bacterium]|nr:alpha/beta fold hydrolase [Actinomycetota bacterium]